MSRRTARRRGRLDLSAALAVTIAVLAIARGWPIAVIGYGAWAVTAVIARGPRRIRRALRAPRVTPLAASSLLAEPRCFPQDIKVQAAVRDGGMCQCPGCPACDWHRNLDAVCGNVNGIQFDHVIPWSAGGRTTLANCRTLCAPCNRQKGAKLS